MKILKKLLMALVVLVLLGAFSLWWVNTQFISLYHISEPVEVLIPKGTGLNKMAHILEEHKVIRSRLLFSLYAKFYNLADKLKAGEYYFGGDMAISDVAQKIAKGDVIVRQVTIPEGKALVEIKKILMDNPYLTGDITLPLNEGDVMPETYHFAKGESRNNVLQKAKDLMAKELQKAFDSRVSGLPYTTKEEMLTLASIVEKETGLKSERAQVASVFINRLRIKMRLQTDPTVIYAVTGGNMDLGRPIYKKDLAFDSPYNTYVYEGLPPAPICSPGRDALYAVAHPMDTKYLYFVADGKTGGHRFATTLEEHNRNVVAYRRISH